MRICPFCNLKIISDPLKRHATSEIYHRRCVNKMWKQANQQKNKEQQT